MCHGRRSTTQVWHWDSDIATRLLIQWRCLRPCTRVYECWAPINSMSTKRATDGAGVQKNPSTMTRVANGKHDREQRWRPIPIRTRALLSGERFCSSRACKRTPLQSGRPLCPNRCVRLQPLRSVAGKATSAPISDGRLMPRGSRRTGTTPAPPRRASASPPRRRPGPGPKS